MLSAVVLIFLATAQSKSSETEDLSGSSFLVHPYANLGLSVALNDAKALTTLTSNKRTSPVSLTQVKKNKYKISIDGVKLCMRDSMLGACKKDVSDTFKLEEVEKPNHKREGRVKGKKERFFKIVAKLKLTTRILLLKLRKHQCLTSKNGLLKFKPCSKYNVDQVFSFEEEEKVEEESASDEEEKVANEANEAPKEQASCLPQCLPPPFNYNGPVHCWNCTNGNCQGCTAGVVPVGQRVVSNVVMAGGVPISGVTLAGGMPINGVPVSGVPISGVPVNGMPINGVPVSVTPLTTVPLAGTVPVPMAGGCDLKQIRNRGNVANGVAPCFY